MNPGIHVKITWWEISAAINRRISRWRLSVFFLNKEQMDFIDMTLGRSNPKAVHRCGKRYSEIKTLQVVKY